MTGEYVPLDQATDEQVAAMLAGRLGNATGELFTLETRTVHYLSDQLVPESPECTMTLTATYSGRTWTWTRTE